MQMNIAKTDKKDAQTIAKYGMQMNLQGKLKFQKPQSDAIYRMQQMQTIIDGYNKQLTMLQNQLENFNSSVMLDSRVKRSIEQTIHKINKEVKKLKLKMKEIASDNYTQTMKLLRSIPEIGIKTAIALIVLTKKLKTLIIINN